MPHGRAREREESFVYSGKRNERERTGSVCARDSSCVIWIVGNRWLKRDEQQQQQRKRMERRRDESLCTTALLPFAIIQRRKAKRKIPKNFVAPVPDIGNQRDDAIRRRSGENNVDIKDLFGGKSIGLKKQKKNKKGEISNDAWEINHRNCCWRIHQMWAQCWLEAADGAPTHFPSFTVVDDDEAFARRKQGKVLELFNSSPTCCHVTGMKHLSMFKTSSNIDQRERERPKLSF